MAKQPIKIVVLGAGYAGMLAAVRLAGRIKREIHRREVAITLINAADVFVERLRLHQLAANQHIARRPITHILDGTGVSFVHGVASGINAVRRVITIETDTGTKQIGYDNLVYALGSTIDSESVPGVRRASSRPYSRRDR